MRKKNAGKRRGKKQQPTNLSPNAVSYSGPITVPGASRGEDMITTLSSEIVDVAWVGGGTTTIFAQYKSFATTFGYTQLYADYREYRCLGMEIYFQPLNIPVSTTGATNTSGYVAASSIEKTPNGTAYVGTTLTTMVDNTSCVLHEGGKPFNRIVRMNGTEEASWGDTSVAAVSQFSVGIVLDTRATYVPAAAVVGTTLVKRLMQWRNKN